MLCAVRDKANECAEASMYGQLIYLAGRDKPLWSSV